MILLTRWSLRHPLLMLLATLLVVLAAAAGMTRLELRTDASALVPDRHPLVRSDRALRDRVDMEDPVVVVLETDHPDGIYNAHSLDALIRLTRALRDVEGLEPDDIISLATEPSDRWSANRASYDGLLDVVPANPEDMQRLRDDVNGVRIYDGTLVAVDGSAAAVFVGVSASDDLTPLLGRLMTALEAIPVAPDRLQLLGAPVAQTLLGTHLLRDLGVPAGMLGPAASLVERPSGAARGPGRYGLVAPALLVMALVFLVVFRTPVAPLLPLLEGGAAVTFTLGLMGWFGVPVYLTLAVLPVILIAVGVADEIHIMERYRRRRFTNGTTDRAAAVHATLSEMTAPVVRTSLTTGVAFLAFAASPLEAVRAFGIFCAVGVLFCLAFSLGPLPALLLLVPERWVIGSARPRITRRDPWGALGRMLTHRRPLVLAVFCGVLVLTVLGVTRVTVRDSWIEGFAADSRFREATARFNRGFHGSHVLLVGAATDEPVARGVLPVHAVENHAITFPATIDPEVLQPGVWVSLHPLPGHAPEALGGQALSRIASVRETTHGFQCSTTPLDGPLRALIRLAETDSVAYTLGRRPALEPETLDAMCVLASRLRADSTASVGGVLGPCEVVSTTAYLLAHRDEAERVIPREPARLKQIWASYGHVRGEGRLREVVSADGRTTALRAFLKEPDYAGVSALMAELGSWETELLEPLGLRMEFGGDIAVSQALIDGVVGSQIRSLGLALLLVFLVAWGTGQGWRYGLRVLIPTGLSVAGGFAVMGFAGIPLGVATSMFGGMMLGIGVDYAIHLQDRRTEALHAGETPAEALLVALRETGPPILINATGLVLGFGVLAVSAVPANARLGILLGITVTLCALLTLGLLPALLARSGGRKTGDPGTARSS